MVRCCCLPLIEYKKERKKKEWKATISALSPNVFLNDSDPTSSFKPLKSISLAGPNLVLGTIKVSRVCGFLTQALLYMG